MFIASVVVFLPNQNVESLSTKLCSVDKLIPFPQHFSNSLIIHVALTQPEHLILVRWMSLETQWKTSWKHGRVWRPCRFEIISNTDANFLNLHIDKATKTRGDKQLYLITHFTKQTLNLNNLLLTLNVTVQLLSYPKKKRPWHSR